MAGLIVVAVNRMPAAEVDVSADLVRRLLADQHPDLARLPVEFLANGWDNELYRVGDGLIARLPRRALGAEIIINEQRWLPGLAPRLPLPIPDPERTGVPACGYPYPWSVVPYLPGVSAAEAKSFDPVRAAAAVGGFLGALHVPAPADAPANPYRGVPLAERAGSFAANLALLTGQAGQDHIDRDAVLRAQDAALAAPGYDGPPVWLHGDLHPANVLVNEGQVSGVIDFGDITAGDPASDLSVAWMLLPPGCHDSFWSAYRAAGPRRRPGRRRPAGAGQRLGPEPCDRVPGALRRQSGTPGNGPPHPARRAGGSARTSRVKGRAARSWCRGGSTAAAPYCALAWQAGRAGMFSARTIFVRIVGAVDDHADGMTPVHPGGAKYGLMARNNRR